MNHRTSRKLMWAMFALSYAVVGLSYLIHITGMPYLFAYIGGALFISAIIEAVLFLRCPHCRGMLYMHQFSPACCPHCSEKLK